MSDPLSQPPTKFAVLNGKYKYAALQELIDEPNVEVRLGIPSGKPLDPYYLPLFAKGAILYNAADFTASLDGAEVVLSYTASQAGLLAQLGAIRKAAELGIKLFVTCEYTLDFDEQDIKTSPYVPGKVLTQEDLDQERYPLVKLRREAVDLANELDLPTLQVHLGIVPENFLIEKSFHPYIDESSSYGWNLKEGKVTILGDGNQPVTFTTKPYYRRWIAHLLTTTPLGELQRLGKVYLAGETLSQNDVIKLWETKYGRKLDVTYVPGLEIEKRWQKIEKERVHNYWTQWPEFIQLQVAKGKGVLPKPTTPTAYTGPKLQLKDVLWETESPGVNE